MVTPQGLTTVSNQFMHLENFCPTLDVPILA